MDYNNITYPLDRIYSNATGVSYPVCGAQGGSTPDPKNEYFYLENKDTEKRYFRNYTTGSPDYTKYNTEYSIDNGTTWTQYDFENQPLVPVESGERIYLRGTKWGNDSSSGVNIGLISDSYSSTIFNTGGNIISLVDYTQMTTMDTLSDTYIFSNLFNSKSIVEFNANFGNISNFSNYTCNAMFRFASKLEKIWLPKVTTWNSTAFYMWLANAGGEATGTKTAYVPAGVNIPEDTSGVPSGWTRVEY